METDIDGGFDVSRVDARVDVRNVDTVLLAPVRDVGVSDFHIFERAVNVDGARGSKSGAAFKHLKLLFELQTEFDLLALLGGLYVSVDDNLFTGEHNIAIDRQIRLDRGLAAAPERRDFLRFGLVLGLGIDGHERDDVENLLGGKILREGFVVVEEDGDNVLHVAMFEALTVRAGNHAGSEVVTHVSETASFLIALTRRQRLMEREAERELEITLRRNKIIL